MAETLLSFGVQKLWDLLARESDRFKEVDEQLTELKSDLSLLRSFLKDADAKKHASALVKNCVEEIKEIVFDTEDIIETFLLKEELRKTRDIKKRMRRLSCIIADRREIASDMGGISKRISKVIRDMQSFGVQQLIVNGGEYSHPLQERQREMRHTFPSDNESDLVGLEENVKKLVGYLVEEDNIQVVSIAGMGGIGKTTLARQVFSHEMVKNHFDGVAWVCVSQQFTRKYVWGMILQKLSPKHDEHKELEMSEDQLQQKLFQLLETSNSLIVLDDMWKEEDWDRIQPVFPPTKGWKVILTSRNQGVALHADPTCVTFKPECLTFEQSWTLFRRTAFPRKDRSKFMIDVEMEEMGKKMIKHCGGLPLAVKVLGGLLASQQTLSEWKRVYDNIASHIVGGRTTFNEGDCKSVQHVLSLSFEELPISLKHCFLYLAHYPEDYPIYMETLSYYWAAEGIPKPKYYEQASIEEVADIYIEELVKRNMVISERDGRTSRFDTCHLHDMMREICLLKAKEENFLQIVHGTSPAYSKSPCKSRRLVVHRLDETYHQEREMKSPKLRSLLCIFEDGRTDWMAPSLFLSRLQLMRVLNLSEIKFEGGKLPSNIGKLIHLRYLSLFMTRVSHLPFSMRNLKQLIYLNLHVAARSLYVPNIFNNMVQLRFLSFPREIHDKTKLELGHLINLETLENFSTEHASVRDLQGMTRLRTLSILFNSKGCNVETLSSSLSGMSHLENLTIEYSKVYYAKECFFSWGHLRQVYSPTNDEEGFVLKCVHLKQLKLSIYMPRLPDEQHFPSQLTTITLTWCYLEEDPMPVLEKLLHLKEIFLYARAFSGKRMVCSDGGFPQLEKLVLFGIDEWEEWIVEKGSMPLLHVLRIKGCEKLKELPDRLRFTTSLKLLRIFTKEWEWKEKLEKGGEDYYKIQHIPLVQIYL